MDKIQYCRACGLETSILVVFGLQVPSNHFEVFEKPVGYKHPLVLSQCNKCALIQLNHPMPPTMVKSHFKWLTYNEPENHLDDLVFRLSKLKGLESKSARIAGLTYKDDSSLARFKRRGYGNTYRYDPLVDLGLEDPCASLESIQEVLNDSAATQIADKHGLVDLLLVRHVLEHAHDPRRFIRAASKLVKLGGYLLFEMPDCTKFIKAKDYSFIWEEHITYLCPTTLLSLISGSGLLLEESVVYTYPLEDSLIAIVRNLPDKFEHGDIGSNSLLQDGVAFSKGFAERRTRLQVLFSDWQRAGLRVAIFGAGHLAAKFINFYGLENMIDCVIDDNPNKRGLLMPGSRISIRSSAELESRRIDLCLLSLSPDSEMKVRATNQAFVDRGGRFLSIFALNPVSVYTVEI